jgi:replicative DNA helicase
MQKAEGRKGLDLIVFDYQQLMNLKEERKATAGNHIASLSLSVGREMDCPVMYVPAFPRRNRERTPARFFPMRDRVPSTGRGYRNVLFTGMNI